MRLHYRVQGEGRPLVILHGLLGSLDNWQSMAKRLAALRRVYSLDLRNHGHSPHSPTIAYDAMAEDVLEFLGEHDLREPAVLGHSMGGKVALQLAAGHSGSIDKLLIVDIGPKAYPPAHRALLAAMGRLNLHGSSSFAEVDSALASAIAADPALRQFVLKNLTREGSGEFRWRIGLDEISRSYDALTEKIVITTPFPKPACFIRGEQSNFIEDHDLPAIREAFPRAEFVTIPRAGHWIHIDAADAFYAAAAKFLAD
jgi:esterase